MWSDFLRSAVQVSWSVAGATLLSYWTERERLQLRASRRSATRKIIRLKSFFLEPRVCDHLDEVGLTERFRRSRKPVFFFFFFFFFSPRSFGIHSSSVSDCNLMMNRGVLLLGRACLRVYWKWKIMICHMRMYEKGLQKSLGGWMAASRPFSQIWKERIPLTGRQNGLSHWDVSAIL